MGCRREQFPGLVEPHRVLVLRRRHPHVFAEDAAEPRVAHAHFAGDLFGRAVAAEVCAHDGFRAVDLLDDGVVGVEQVAVLEEHRPQDVEHDARNERLESHALLLDRADDLAVAPLDAAAAPDPQQGAPAAEEPLLLQAVDIGAAEADPPLRPSGAGVGRIGVPFVGEEQEHGARLDRLRGAGCRFEAPPPGGDVDQLVFVERAAAAFVKQVVLGVFRDGVGRSGRDVLVPGRGADDAPLLVARGDWQVVKDAQRPVVHSVKSIYSLSKPSTKVGKRLYSFASVT